MTPLIPLAVVGGAVAYNYWPKLRSHPLTNNPDGAPDHPAAGQGQTIAAKVKEQGLAKPAAIRVYAYVKPHGNDHSPALSQLVHDFQDLSNKDPDAKMLTGPIPVTGIYDDKTSAALTLYTHDPVPASFEPTLHPPLSFADKTDFSKPGSAATSGYNLYMFIKAHGVPINDPNFIALVKQFQLDFNTDPKYPGPSSNPLPSKIKTKLPVDGKYTANVRDAGMITWPDDPLKGYSTHRV